MLVFDAIVNGIVFFIFFPGDLLLVYRIINDFCRLILNPETSLNSFISPKSILVESSEFSIHKIMSSTNKDNFVSSFLIRMCISFFSHCSG